MIVDRRKRTRRRVYPLINIIFCHELFTHVFVMLDLKDLIQATLTCRLWRHHIKEMQETLFRHFYIHLGGDPATRMRRGIVESWKEEVRMIVMCDTDLSVFQYAWAHGDEMLKDSVISDGGLYMDLCNYIVQYGGSVFPHSLVLYFKKRLMTQTAKWEFHDIIYALCYMDESSDPKFCLRACVDNGNLLKRLRAYFLSGNPPIDTLHMNLFIKEFILSRKLQDDIQTKTEIWNIVKIMANVEQQDTWSLKKIESTKRLGIGRGKGFLF